MQPTSLSALEASRLMKAGELSPVELMEATIEAAYAVNEKFAAFITIAQEQALTQAREVELAYAQGRELRPYAGLPVAIKDTEDTAGLRTTYGSPLYAEHVPSTNGAAAENIRKSGIIVFAKSSTPAFGHNDSSENLLGPAVLNPRNPAFSAAGSSSGAAAAVASGLSPFAHGTDGSGSVRIPASVCGIVGFKPSYGRIPAWPHRDLWAGRTHHGVLARTVQDAAVGMAVMSGHNELDPLANTAVVDWLSYPEIGGLLQDRGIYVEQLGQDEVDEEVAQCCRQAVALLTKAGLLVQERQIALEPTHGWYCDLWHPAIARQLGPQLETRPELVDPSLKAMIEAGREVSLDRFMAARESRSVFHTAFTRLMAGVDYLICPTLPCAAWPVGELPKVGGGKPPLHGHSGSRWESVYLFNILGWPAISVPCGVTQDGRPIGIQIVARKDQDLLCLRIADVLEQSLRPSVLTNPTWSKS